MSESRIWWHWQNLNERPGDNLSHGKATGHPFWYGRAWLHLYRMAVLHVCWHFGQFNFGLELHFNEGEREITARFTVPLVSLYFSVGGKVLEPFFRLLGMDHESCERRIAREKANGGRHRYAYEDSDRRIGIRIFDWAIWWSCWERELVSYGDDPWWQHGVWHPLDTLFGKWEHRQEVLETRQVTVALPEGAYAATAMLERRTWWRRRWPWWPAKHVRLTVDIEVPGGIPIPGKGESEWNCGPDAIYSRSCATHSIEEGVGGLVTSVLKTRRERGAPDNYSERPQKAKVSA